MVAWLSAHSTRVLIGLALAILPLFYFAYIGASWNPLVPHEHLVQNVLAYIFLVLFSFFNHTVFVPRWFLTKQYRRYAIVAVSCVFMAAYLPHRVEQWLFFKLPRENTPLAWARQIFVEEMMLETPPDHSFNPHAEADRPDFGPFGRPGGPDRPMGPPGPPPFEHQRERDRQPLDHQPPPFTLMLSVKLVIFFLLGSVSTLISISVQTASRLHQVENDQLQAELRQLKAQIQPHFLFNTLNSIYALAIHNDARTADTIVKLSEFMRYIIRDAHRDKVLLEREIQYIGNYIDLQKARLRDAVLINYQLEGDAKHLEIAPLLLFSFIENAFKHGVSPDEESQIDIRLRMEDASLNLYVANKKIAVRSFEDSTGVGLQNAKERLRLLYPDDHQLTIDNTPTDFRVYLSLKLSS